MMIITKGNVGSDGKDVDNTGQTLWNKRRHKEVNRLTDLEHPNQNDTHKVFVCFNKYAPRLLGQNDKPSQIELRREIYKNGIGEGWNYF